jgi:hypothetical protein
MFSPVGLFGKRQCAEMVVDVVHEVGDLRRGDVLPGNGAEFAGEVAEGAFHISHIVISRRH